MPPSSVTRRNSSRGSTATNAARFRDGKRLFGPLTPRRSVPWHARLMQDCKAPRPELKLAGRWQKELGHAVQIRVVAFP